MLKECIHQHENLLQAELLAGNTAKAEYHKGVLAGLCIATCEINQIQTHSFEYIDNLYISGLRTTLIRMNNDIKNLIIDITPTVHTMNHECRPDATAKFSNTGGGDTLCQLRDGDNQCQHCGYPVNIVTHDHCPACGLKL